MEDLLQQIIKDCSGGVKHAEVRSVCLQVHDFLEAQQGTLRAPPYELRQRCLTALQLALESRHSKLISAAVCGFQKLLRDDRFHSNLECESEEQWMPSQLLTAVASLRTQPEDVQVDILNVLLNMACATWWSMNESVILRILGTCRDSYVGGNLAVKIASQATASQTLRAFSDHLDEEEKAATANPYFKSQLNGDRDSTHKESVFDRMVHILHHLCTNLQQQQQRNNGSLKERVIPFYLESVLTLVSSLPQTSCRSSSLLDYLWQELCPMLLSLLGNPTSETTGISDIHSVVGRSTSKCHLTLTTSEVKTIYSICVELVRLVGVMATLRPMLESMFHRFLFHTSSVHRLEALRATKEIMKRPDRLLNFGGPPLVIDKKGSCSTDLGLLKLVVDAFVECSHCSDSQLCYASVDCVVALLDSLEHICEGSGLSTEHILTLNSLYQDLDSCDYKGPMTYETWEKVQKIALLMKKYTTVTKASETEDCVRNEVVDESGSSLSTGDLKEELDAHDYDDEQKGAIVLDDQSDATATGTSAAECVSIDGEEMSLPKNNCEGDPPSGYETDSSGSTEGPEEGFEEEEVEVVENFVDEGNEVEEERRKRIPKTLVGKEECREEQERMARLYETRDVYAQQERRNARHFTKLLESELCSWLSIKSSIEADEILQEFASKYCEAIVVGQNCDADSKGDQAVHRMIINADGVYLAIYTTLLLNLNLIQSNYYNGLKDEPPLTEEEFIENVHGSGVLVYLSADWLAELYQQVLVCNYLENAGYDRLSRNNSALINLLTDLEGTNGEHLLSDYYRLEKAVTSNDGGLEMEAGRKFARRVLTGCWDGVLEVLSALLNEKNAVGIKNNIGLMLGTENAKEEHRKARDAIASSLDGLQKAARLSNILNLHSRCETVFALLSAVSCPVAESQQGFTPVHRRKLRSSGLLSRPRPIRLHVSHVLSMDVMLSRGLELGSHSPDCWKHVFRCCSYVADLEHLYFSQGVTHSSTSKSSSHKEMRPSKSDKDDFKDEEVSLPSILFPSGAQPLSVVDYMKQNVTNLSSNGVLSPEQTIQMLCSLSQQVDRLFDDAAYKLNLKSLLGFLKELCSASQSALFSKVSKRVNPSNPHQKGSSFPHHYRGNMLLLHRLGDVMLKSVRSGRPLIHVMQSWSVIGLHLMEAACHKDQEVAKRAVTCIHDIVSALLASQSELPYFHFNEALFKPFENLLCLELCDVDIQDQIISSICEFVEGSKTEICSGWRPLFGALRAVRSSAPFLVAAVESDGNSRLNSSHVRAVIDVFDAFLNTENVLVFANAAVDCILCLLKHIRGSDFVEGDIDLNSDQSPGTVPDLCLECLKCIHTCCGILASMHQMPACPIFLSSNRIQLGSASQLVDPDISGQTLVLFNRESEQNVNENTPFLDSLLKNLVTLQELEQPSGILHVWCLVLEGLVGAVATFPRCYQPCTMETLFFLLHKIFELPGVEFGLYVVNHILLPMMQSWLRRTARLHRGWESFASNFKQCCGQTTDLVVDYLAKLSESNQLQTARGGTFVLYQLLQLMTECISQPNESIARLGCSCIRHVVVASGSILTSDMWEVVCEMLRRACDVSLFNVRQLTVAFNVNSDNFYGDVCQVKVAASSDCSPQENERLKQLAQQVFLLDSQQSLSNGLLEESVDDDRSYVFLLYPLDNNDQGQPFEANVVKVPFRSMVVGLISHQIILQTIGLILLNGMPHVVPSLANILLQSPAPTPSSSRPPIGSRCSTSSKSESKLPGMVGCLSGRQVSTLLVCLKDSYNVSCQFDVRPGLKFLVQKVARASAAANLYKQSGASWTIRTVALLEMCLHLLQFDVKSKDRSDLTACQTWVTELKATFVDVGVLYAELFMRKNDDDQFARLQDQPIFFLVAQTDDYMEMRHKNDDPKKKSDSGDGQASTVPSPKEERGSEEATSKTALVESPERAEDALKELRVDKDDNEEVGSEDEDEGEREEQGDSLHVYEVATRKDIDTMVNEFKRRKQQHAMPSNKRERSKKAFSWETDDGRTKRNREETKLPSVLKDRHACIKVRTEMLLSIFDFVCQVDDGQFKALLPITFPFVRTLVAHGNDATLRQILAEFLDRIASLYQFANGDP